MVNLLKLEFLSIIDSGSDFESSDDKSENKPNSGDETVGK